MASSLINKFWKALSTKRTIFSLLSLLMVINFDAAASDLKRKRDDFAESQDRNPRSPTPRNHKETPKEENSRPSKKGRFETFKETLSQHKDKVLVAGCIASFAAGAAIDYFCPGVSINIFSYASSFFANNSTNIGSALMPFEAPSQVAQVISRMSMPLITAAGSGVMLSTATQFIAPSFNSCPVRENLLARDGHLDSDAYLEQNLGAVQLQPQAPQPTPTSQNYGSELMPTHFNSAVPPEPYDGSTGFCPTDLTLEGIISGALLAKASSPGTFTIVDESERNQQRVDTSQNTTSQRNVLPQPLQAPIVVYPPVLNDPRMQIMGYDPARGWIVHDPRIVPTLVETPAIPAREAGTLIDLTDDNQTIVIDLSSEEEEGN